MRRLYVLPLETHHALHGLYPASPETHWLALCPSSSQADLDVWSGKGCPVVVSTAIRHEASLDALEEPPLVTVLTHPVWQSDSPITLARKLTVNANNLRWGSNVSTGCPGIARNGTLLPSVALPSWGSSLEGEETVETDGIDHLLNAGLGIAAMHTVLDVQRILAARHPAFKAREFR